MVSKKSLLIIGIAAVAVIFLPPAIKLLQLRLKHQELQSKIIELKAQNRNYLNEINRLDTDPDYVEKVAREKMGIIKKGEIVFKEERQTAPPR